MLSSFTVDYTIVALLMFPQHQKQNTKSKTAMPHSPGNSAMARSRHQNKRTFLYQTRFSKKVIDQLQLVPLGGEKFTKEELQQRITHECWKEISLQLNLESPLVRGKRYFGPFVEKEAQSIIVPPRPTGGD
jgi:hypothetical protein